MNANDLLARYGEHPERIMIAQFLLGGERQARQITQRLQVVGMESCPLECGAIVRHVIVGVPQRPLQTLQLQRLELLAARRLDRLEITGRGLSDRHASSLRGLYDMALDAIRFAAKERDALTALIDDLDVVDACAAADAALLRDGRQYIAFVRRRDEIDRAARRYRRQVVAVAGKRERAVGEREDEAAVADGVTVQHVLANRH